MIWNLNMKKTPRKYHSSIPETVEKLPLKSKEGLIKRIELLKNEKLPESNIDSNDNEQEESSELNDIKQDTMEISEENDDKIPDSIKDLKNYLDEQESIKEKKKEIGTIAKSILSNSETNINLFRNLFKLCSDTQPIIMQLAIASALEIFKDIIPGYRIRLPTEKELEVKVSKEVKQLRDYESALLKHYQYYLKILEKIIDG